MGFIGLLLAFAIAVWIQAVPVYGANPVAVQTPIAAPTEISTRTEWKRIGKYDFLYVYVSYSNPDDDRITFNTVRYRPENSTGGWTRNNQTTPGDSVRLPFRYPLAESSRGHLGVSGRRWLQR